MLLTGTIANVAAVLLGSALGLLIGNKLPQRIVNTVFQAIGLFTAVIGLSMALKSEQMLLVVFSLILGAILGEWMQLDASVERLSGKVRTVFKIGNPRFSEGLMTSFLLFCMGAMTIVGAIEEGMGKGSEVLLTKSMMDGFSSLALASALGIGVLFSVVPMLLYQGGITLLAYWLGDFIADAIVTELTAVGGILLIGLAINILEIKKIKVMNMLPSLILIIIFVWIKMTFIH